jgi:DNA helicase II / ATP-dependent DNA helicase PcrA
MSDVPKVEKNMSSSRRM